MNREKLIEELSPFSDIGEAIPKASETDEKLTLRMTRDGRQLRVVVDKLSAKVQTSSGAGTTRNYASIAAMLASPIFANLGRWADAQKELLKRDAVAEKKLIPINGVSHRMQEVLTIEDADNLLGCNERPTGATEILLIDGPAGIGKTNLIEQLALLRAENYKTSPRPLILHVKSRGRVLSNIQDLMAFSLQTIRSNITYDQIPILARYGLVTLAIDGFDELGDPNGYDLAWAQLGELVSYIRGQGTVILSGRDTFMGRSRLIKEVQAIREGVDIVTGLTLRPPTPVQAKEWLIKNHQWIDANFDLPAISVLFEEDSFALRPVFLKLLGEHVKAKQLREKQENYLTTTLVQHMIEREATKFGKPVEAQLSKHAIEKFVADFLHELAREMADSQTESLDASTMGWIAEASLGDGYPAEIVGLIKNRANVIAFLEPDERTGYRRFINSHLMNYFLARVTINVIGNGEIPKYVRRNLIGSEFLSVFADVCLDYSETDNAKIQNFLGYAIAFPQRHTFVDRGIRNVGALVLATLPYLSASESNIVRNFQVDEAIARGTSAAGQIVDVAINQLDCRGADLSLLTFENASVVHVIANDSSRFSRSFPLPKVITRGDGQEIYDPGEIEKWLDARGRDEVQTVAQGLASASLRNHRVYRLLGRLCRLRQYWVRPEDEIVGTKIFQDPNWPMLASVLREHDFLREEERPASGGRSVFVHVRQRERILAESKDDEAVVRFFDDLASRI
ncbi:hypothetical protein [Burkholderia ubonensis]|uniref:hypothetical protein n=1 Tax=Burkholderia ubonensis TaxID=101571 RepID=UPI000AA3D24F|nr:hypothetical protein [Burkholderia ubonensis]